MTFILNVLHKDMSLLAADQKATLEGPATITMPDMTIHAKDGATIHGYRKITLNQDRSLAVGVAGNALDHGYTQAIEHSGSVDEGLKAIRDHMEGYLRVHERANLIAMNEFIENKGIASFYDVDAGTYFSNIFLFSRVHSYTHLYARTMDGACLLHVGSGSDHFENAVGVDEINAFVASTKESCTPEACIQWVREAYRKVSAIDSGTGEDITFAISTRDSPEFRSIGHG